MLGEIWLEERNAGNRSCASWALRSRTSAPTRLHSILAGRRRGGRVQGGEKRSDPCGFANNLIHGGVAEMPILEYKAARCCAPGHQIDIDQTRAERLGYPNGYTRPLPCISAGTADTSTAGAEEMRRNWHEPPTRRQSSAQLSGPSRVRPSRRRLRTDAKVPQSSKRFAGEDDPPCHLTIPNRAEARSVTSACGRTRVSSRFWGGDNRYSGFQRTR